MRVVHRIYARPTMRIALSGLLAPGSLFILVITLVSACGGDAESVAIAGCVTLALGSFSWLVWRLSIAAITPDAVSSRPVSAMGFWFVGVASVG